MDYSSDSEDSLELAAKTWNRVVEGASKTGYREGIEEGTQAVFQGDFDKGYEDGFKAAFELGKYKGLAAAFSKDYKHPEYIEEILDKTRRGACHICILESKDKGIDGSNLSSTDILADHAKHVVATIRILHDYFEPFMKERGIDINQLKTE